MSTGAGGQPEGVVGAALEFAPYAVWSPATKLATDPGSAGPDALPDCGRQSSMMNAITNEEIRRPQPPPITEPKPRPEEPREDQKRPYEEFLKRKRQLANQGGFEPLWMPDFLFDFQKSLVEWSVQQGRAAIFADCGMGKTPCQLVWAENVVRKTNRPVLILTPLAVTSQTVHEGEKFGVECHLSRDGRFPSGARVVVSNYEKLHLFNTADFAGVVGDESSILKNFDGTRKAAITEFLRTVPYRLLCTATAAPNDYIELGTHSEALGAMGYMDMLSRFFKNDQRGVHANSVWGGSKWRFRGHSERDFWRWVCSWSRAARKPSDLGGSDAGFVLPELQSEEHVVQARFPREGRLFDALALNRDDELEARRRTLPERCERVAALLADTGKPAIAWCHLNPEGDLIEKLIPNAAQVTGSDSDERKEEVFMAFARGEVRVLVTKGTIAGFGLNWQHCAHMTFFPSHSFEQYYQCVRRCWRFGQVNPVKVEVITSECETGVVANLQRKARQADAMFAQLVDHMQESLVIARPNPFVRSLEVPAWL